MGAATHKLMSSLTEQQSDAAADTLKKLTDYRGKLTHIIRQSQAQHQALLAQRDQHVEVGAEAMALMMIEQSLMEHQQHMQEVGEELALLDVAIQEQRQKWAVIYQKHQAHEKMGNNIEKQERRVMERKKQKVADGQFSARMVMQRGEKL